MNFVSLIGLKATQYALGIRIPLEVTVSIGGPSALMVKDLFCQK